LDHVVGEAVGSLAFDGDGAGGGDASDLVAEGQQVYACPEAVVDYLLVLLVKAAVHGYAGQRFKLC
jgi:hypothetical protein